MFKTQENNSFFSQFFEENKNERSSVSRQEVHVRLGFMKKVYGMLSIQLLVTVIISAFIMFTPTLRNFLVNNSWLLTVFSFGCLGCILALEWKKKEFPTNVAILGAFTVMEASTLGVLISFYDAWVVLQAFCLTFAILIGLTAYTFTSKKDFGWLGQSLASGLWVLIIGGLLQFFIRSNFLHLTLSVGGAFLFAVFIIYDTHLIMKKLSAEDYIMGVITLYLDVINLFLKLLKILQYLNNSNNSEKREKREKKN